MQGDEGSPRTDEVAPEPERELRRTREELRRTRRRLDDLNALINRSAMVVFRWRVVPGVWPVELVSLNVRQFGYEPEEFTSGNLTWSAVVHPEDLQAAEAELEDHAARNVQGFTQRYRILTKSGESRWVDDHTISILDDEGRLTHYEGMLLDVTERVRDEATRIESEARFAAFFEATPIPLAIVVGGRYQEVNSAFELVLGFAREEVIGHDAAELGIAVDEEDFERATRALLEEGRFTNSEMHFRSKDGSEHVGLFSGRLMSVGPRKVFLTAVLDITERKRSEENLRRAYADVEQRVAERTAELSLALQSLRGREEQVQQLLQCSEQRAAEMDATINSIADGVLICNPELELVRSNAAAAEIVGHERIPLGRHLNEWLAMVDLRRSNGEPLPLDETATMRAVKLGVTTRGLVTNIAGADGHRRWMSISAAPIHTSDKALVGAVTTFSDISALHDLQQRQEDLLHIVSHDLRMPLSVIRGHMELLEETLEEHGLGERLSRSVSTIDRNVKRMDKMIQDLVDITLLEGRRFELSSVEIELHDYLADLLSRLEDILSVDRIDLRVPADLPAASADEGRLERIVLNLLSNALKYAPGESPVILSAYGRDDEIVVSVSDSGPGIAPNQLPQLFGRFYRAKDKEKGGGIGLGLFITKLLVEAHGGRIWVESTPGQGTTFYFTLPVLAARG